MGLEILEKDGSIATMRNEDGTALHVLARMDISPFRSNKRILDTRRMKKATTTGSQRKTLASRLISIALYI